MAFWFGSRGLNNYTDLVGWKLGRLLNFCLVEMRIVVKRANSNIVGYYKVLNTYCSLRTRHDVKTCFFGLQQANFVWSGKRVGVAPWLAWYPTGGLKFRSRPQYIAFHGHVLTAFEWFVSIRLLLSICQQGIRWWNVNSGNEAKTYLSKLGHWIRSIDRKTIEAPDDQKSHTANSRKAHTADFSHSQSSSFTYNLVTSPSVILEHVWRRTVQMVKCIKSLCVEKICVREKRKLVSLVTVHYYFGHGYLQHLRHVQASQVARYSILQTTKQLIWRSTVLRMHSK